MSYSVNRAPVAFGVYYAVLKDGVQVGMLHNTSLEAERECQRLAHSEMVQEQRTLNAETLRGMSDDKRHPFTGKPRLHPAMNQPGGVDFVQAVDHKSKRERIDRLRKRISEARDTEHLKSVLRGVLDLLGDEL